MRHSIALRGFLGRPIPSSMAGFKGDPLFLAKYHWTVAALVLPMLIGLWAYHPLATGGARWPWLVSLAFIAFPALPINVIGVLGFLFSLLFLSNVTWSPADALWPVAGIALGMYSGAIMHFVGHRNFRSGLVHRVIAELCSWQQLVSHHGWTVAHMLHHLHADDPLEDPHALSGQSIFAYGVRMKFRISRHVERFFFECWKSEAHAKKYWDLTGASLLLSTYALGLLWLLLLGPKAFVLFYLPSFLAVNLFYVHFNYVTHLPNADGKNEARNLNQGLFYALINRFFFGAYCHGNHHDNPRHMNPMKMK